MTASVPRLQAYLNFLVNAIDIFYGCFQIFELFDPLKGCVEPQSTARNNELICLRDIGLSLLTFSSTFAAS
jgi:hypothetical protein